MSTTSTTEEMALHFMPVAASEAEPIPCRVEGCETDGAEIFSITIGDHLAWAGQVCRRHCDDLQADHTGWKFRQTVGQPPSITLPSVEGTSITFDPGLAGTPRPPEEIWTICRGCYRFWPHTHTTDRDFCLCDPDSTPRARDWISVVPETELADEVLAHDLDRVHGLASAASEIQFARLIDYLAHLPRSSSAYLPEDLAKIQEKAIRLAGLLKSTEAEAEHMPRCPVCGGICARRRSKPGERPEFCCTKGHTYYGNVTPAPWETAGGGSDG